MNIITHKSIKKKQTPEVKKRTPEYAVVQYCGLTTGLFLFAYLEKATKKYAIRANVRISIFL